MSENPASTGAKIGWITLAGLVAVAAFFVGRVDRAVDRASAVSAHETQQNAATALVARDLKEHVNAAEPLVAQLHETTRIANRTERKVDLLTVWLRMVGRVQGWPDFPDPARVPRLPDPGPGLYAAEITHRCP